MAAALHLVGCSQCGRDFRREHAHGFSHCRSHLQAPACHCAAYHFPHRPGGGACGCTWSAVGGAVVLSQVCACCGLAADTHEEDEGIGATEFWGSVSVHEDWREVTDCCGAELVENTARTAAERRRAA